MTAIPVHMKVGGWEAEIGRGKSTNMVGEAIVGHKGVVEVCSYFNQYKTRDEDDYLEVLVLVSFGVAVRDQNASRSDKASETLTLFCRVVCSSLIISILSSLLCFFFLKPWNFLFDVFALKKREGVEGGNRGVGGGG